MKKTSFARRLFNVLGLILVISLSLTVLSACSGGEAPSGDGVGYSVRIEGLEIKPDMEMEQVIEALGTNYKLNESSACPPFKGIERLYDFTAVQITTYSDGSKDRIMSIFLKDDSTNVSGVQIGSTVDEMTEALGKSYKESAGTYTYTADDGSTLKCIVKNGSVASIRIVTGKAES